MADDIENETDPDAAANDGAPKPKAKRAAKAKPKAAAAIEDDDDTDDLDDEGPPPNPNETIPGGAYRRGTTIRGNKHYGGHIGDANGKILATFADRQENTGRIEDGHKPDAE